MVFNGTKRDAIFQRARGRVACVFFWKSDSFILFPTQKECISQELQWVCVKNRGWQTSLFKKLSGIKNDAAHCTKTKWIITQLMLLSNETYSFPSLSILSDAQYQGWMKKKRSFPLVHTHVWNFHLHSLLHLLPCFHSSQMHVWVFFPPCSLSLDAASQVYLQSGSTTVWVLFSPARSYGRIEQTRQD